MNDEFKVDAQNLEQKIEIEKFIQMLLLSSDVESSVSSDSQFVESVGKLSQLSLDELVSAPQRIQKEEGNLRHKIEQLAVENYPIFLANANTSREVHREFMSISESNEILLSSIAGVSSVAQTIFDNVGKSASAFRTSAKSVQQYAQVRFLFISVSVTLDIGAPGASTINGNLYSKWILSRCSEYIKPHQTNDKEVRSDDPDCSNGGPSGSRNQRAALQSSL